MRAQIHYKLLYFSSLSTTDWLRDRIFSYIYVFIYIFRFHMKNERIGEKKIEIL